MSNEEWRADVKQAFERFDQDGNGKIDRGEFEQLLDALGSTMSANDREMGFHLVDEDEDGTITLDELAAWWDVVRLEGH